MLESGYEGELLPVVDLRLDIIHREGRQIKDSEFQNWRRELAAAMLKTVIFGAGNKSFAFDFQVYCQLVYLGDAIMVGKGGEAGADSNSQQIAGIFGSERALDQSIYVKARHLLNCGNRFII